MPCVGVSDKYDEIRVTSASLDVDVRYKTKSVPFGFSPYLIMRTLMRYYRSTNVKSYCDMRYVHLL